MLIIEDYRGCYGDGLERYCGFDRFSHDDGKNILFHGMGCIEYPLHKLKYKDYEKKIFWNLEHPCAWYHGDKNFAAISANMDKYFQKIFTICPYTADWLNTLQKSNVFSPSYLPFNKNNVIDKKEDKEFDVIYWGHIFADIHINFIDAMKDFKYNFLSLGEHEWAAPYRHLGYEKLITSINMSRSQMWDTLRKTKICLITNHAYLTPSQIANVKSIRNWQKCEAFSHIDDGWVPQYKTRMIESAVNRTLMLVKKNPWKVDEMWFEADKEFIFFENDDELPSLIEEISSNWHKYENIVENAFIKATTDYTVENFLNLVERSLDDE
tara:strand:+ start:1645 stop:2616 length:972 start_codon:yes stop_codon:yes gene_type:complete